MKNVFKLMILLPVLSLFGTSVTVLAVGEESLKRQLITQLQELGKGVVKEFIKWNEYSQLEETYDKIEKIYVASILRDDIDKKQEEEELRAQAAEIRRLEHLHRSDMDKESNQEVFEGLCSLGDSYVQRLVVSGLPVGKEGFIGSDLASAAFNYRYRCLGYSEPKKGTTKQGAMASKVLVDREVLYKTQYEVMKTGQTSCGIFISTEKFVNRFFDGREKLEKCLKNPEECGN